MNVKSLVILAPFTLLGGANIAHAAQKKSSPNIIMIVVDDMGYGDWGCYGSTINQTPNIDALAANGKRFTSFYTNGNVSSPTRAALMTGCYQQRTGIEGVIKAASDRDKGMNPQTVTIAKLLKANNYETAIYGKWHLGYAPKHNPINLGFDEFVGYVSGNVDYFSHIDMAGYKDWWHQDQLVEEEGYTTSLITDYAQKFLEREHEKPFFLYLPYEACHDPMQGPEDSAKRVIKDGKMVTIRSKKSSPDVYTKMAEAFDRSLGRLMTTLKESGLEENTLVLLFSDNGGSKHASCAPFSGRKGSMYEGGIRVSSIAYWPKRIKAGSECDQPIITMDLLPTICKLTSTSLDGNRFDGLDILPTILSNKKVKERTLFWRMGGDLAARKGNWKIIVSKKSGKQILIDLSKDIKEEHNLWDEYPEVASQMLREAEVWESQFETQQTK